MTPKIIWLRRDGFDQLRIFTKKGKIVKEILIGLNIKYRFLSIEKCFEVYDTSRHVLEKLITHLGPIEQWLISKSIMDEVLTPKYEKKLLPSNTKFYDDQSEVFDKVAAFKKVILHGQFGTGKTWITKTLANSLNRKTLILCPSYLVSSWSLHLQVDECEIMEISEKTKFDPLKYGLIITDEAHALKGKPKLIRLIKKASAEYKIAVSGNKTLFEPGLFEDLLVAFGVVDSLTMARRLIQNEVLLKDVKGIIQPNSLKSFPEISVFDVEIPKDSQIMSHFFDFLKKDIRFNQLDIAHIRNFVSEFKTKKTPGIIQKLQNEGVEKIGVISSNIVYTDYLLENIKSAVVFDPTLDQSEYSVIIYDFSSFPEGTELLDRQIVIVIDTYTSREGRESAVGRFVRRESKTKKVIKLLSNHPVDRIVSTIPHTLSKKVEFERILTGIEDFKKKSLSLADPSEKTNTPGAREA